MNPNNSGQMQWGEKYRGLHSKAWKECYRVLEYGGTFVLNISNHIRNGKEIDVTGWHIKEIESLGFQKIEHIKVKTRRQRLGLNGNLRVENENIIVFIK